MNIPDLHPPVIAAKIFPTWVADGASVDAKAHIEPKTSLAVGLGWTLVVFFLLISILLPFILAILLLGCLADYLRQRKVMAMLKGSSIEIGPTQFPEIYACAETLSRRLGLEQTPAIYLIEGNVINAAAARIAGRRIIILLDDMVDACLRSEDPRTLTFILGHELAHHALGHTGYVRRHLATMMKWLSRLDEFSCDAVAHQLTGDKDVTAKALILLLVGPQMLPYVNTLQLIEQARQVEADKKTKKAERQLSHPVLLRRLYRFVT